MMPEAKYLLVGSSHAALEALRAIRLVDPDGTMAMLTRDGRLPYSPTILPYVVSGRSAPERVLLRDPAFFAANNCTYVPNARVVSLDPKTKAVSLESGEVWRYQTLLIATGAAPAIPPVKGLDSVRYHVLRTLADAEGLRSAMGAAKSAVVLGAGLVGLHAAENLAEAGLKVTVVEMQDHVLPGYFDAKASTRIEEAFTKHGVNLLLGRRVTEVAPGKVTVDDGGVLDADLLLVATGVRPVTDWLEGSGVTVDKGVLVDEAMRTNIDGVWAAGDVAQATDFASGKPALIGIIPTAVEQGKIAGQGMAGDSYRKDYAGGLPVNTYRFFGRVALSIGRAAATEGVEAVETDGSAYRRLVLEDNRLVGYASVDEPFDVGIMGELIRRRVDLSACKDAFLARPVETGRRLMSEQWR
ncbi:NADH-dependent phenylglyoxylate dehydrogenase subunit epsilon [Magnetospirillum sp. XM-1]|uniref:NADH-dependent phenylglyoxylate dehydrogenase subunit epsilon n=1 Tax=Magnetospirillum sp. XM-1 TaxID=1663591 RepID=UPI00073DE29A|nr:NAD(P)/FAD-dependent oxidoreductase [Magnetospirillum sp. XM-1]CUW40948.1 NADH-dependent phenylglyoxylate dehydrogenase subunit epsilon [Magnetospirillum sp. XM-1]